MKTSRTLKQMIWFSVSLLVWSLICFAMYHIKHQQWMLSVYVTFLTTFYHFAMRLIVGETVTVIYKNRDFDMNSFGFRIRNYEHKLYKMLHVKKWKSKVITAKPEQFDLRKVSPEEILHNMLQAELVHRCIMVLSFLPLLLIIPYGVPLVFISTSIVACLIDSVFVIIQRYNRPRILKILKRYKKS